MRLFFRSLIVSILRAHNWSAPALESFFVNLSGAVGAVLGDAIGEARIADNDLAPPSLDVDANGEADALTDGILILRYLFGFTSGALIDDGRNHARTG